ncbi:hypothetical protein [Bradyrhizobium retamae]|uniref:Uncharacterized protein n=1 Tax=Bradyrhizobium retamae TaxID=1300035 RepID=A0A0R3MN00_9BRAD|nr:hypothetical protein [Bradyrhizobium retamae]KRR21688.1 hypothetical protein CQ13_06455 [Bradyrhizobium retamae]
MQFRIRDIATGELTGNFAAFDPAKTEAERLCAANDRQRHFSVVRIEDVYTTQLLEEALRKPKTLADRSRLNRDHNR